MGSRGGFDNSMAGGCIPRRGVEAVDVKIKLRAGPSTPPDARSHEWATDFTKGAVLPSAYHRLVPPSRDTPQPVFEFASGFVLVVFWLMGGLWASTWQYVEITFPVILVATVILYAYARDLNLMLSGEESAQHLGVSVENLKKILLVTFRS